MSDDNLRKYYANQLKRQEYLKIGFKQGFEAGYAKAKEDFERPHGEWKYHKYDRDYECSICNTRYDAFDLPVKTWDYCPNCGASMKEGDEE